jgi:hypothetical protein
MCGGNQLLKRRCILILSLRCLTLNLTFHLAHIFGTDTAAVLTLNLPTNFIKPL